MLVELLLAHSMFCNPVWRDSVGKTIGTPPPPNQLVKEAELIVIASPEKVAFKRRHGDGSRRLPETFLSFRIIQTLKGSARDSSIVLPGVVVESDELNVRRVPYQWPRNSSLYGSCFTFEYKIGAAYLLFLLRNRPGEFGTDWAPLRPVNEQVTGIHDPWVQWTRFQTAGRGLAPARLPHQALDSALLDTLVSGIRSAIYGTTGIREPWKIFLKDSMSSEAVQFRQRLGKHLIVRDVRPGDDSRATVGVSSVEFGESSASVKVGVVTETLCTSGEWRGHVTEYAVTAIWNGRSWGDAVATATYFATGVPCKSDMQKNP